MNMITVSILRLSLALPLVSPAFAGLSRNAIVAAMALAEQPNYSWTSIVEDDAGSYVIEGKTSQEGYTRVTLPMVEDIARRLGREAESTLEAIFKGPDHFVVHFGGEWKTVPELPRARRDDGFVVYHVMPSTRFTMDPLDPSDPFPTILAVPVPIPEPDKRRPFSNARLAASPPHEELALIVSSYTKMTADGDTVTGEIADPGASLLLCPGDESFATPVIAAGRFKLWLKDNLVVRYQLHLEGLLLVDRNKREVLVRQTSDTRVTNVGRTVVDVPNAARLKFDY
jgi:hypothetical protein